MTSLDSLSTREREVLNHAVSALYFNDSSDYINALWDIVYTMLHVECDPDIRWLYKQLNPEG
jgi:hypothetical protein